MSDAADDPLADVHLFPARFAPGETHGLAEAEHLSRYWWASAYVDQRSVLDAGCGVGYGSRRMAAAGASSVTGVDISEAAIARASEHADERVTFIVGDLGALPFRDGSFDVAVCFETIEQVADQSRALRELRRALAPDGLLLISSPNRNAYQQGNPYHTHVYTPDELCDALRERFAHVRLERQATWLASMICDDTLLQAGDPARALRLDVRKVGGLAPGCESFTLALASDAELPPARALTFMAGAEELDAWRGRGRSAEQHAERARQAGIEAAAAYRALEDAYRNALATIEQQTDRARQAGADAASSYRSLEETYRALRRDYDNALAAIGQHETNAAVLAEQQRALHAELDGLAAREHQLSARAADLERELDAANAELAEIRRSPVWRASAPLRALTRRGKTD
jgi:SAM-dependent methyltransferase